MQFKSNSMLCGENKHSEGETRFGARGELKGKRKLSSAEEGAQEDCMRSWARQGSWW